MESTADPVVFLLNFGTLGVVFVLLLTGMLYTKPYVQRLEKEITDKDRVLEQFRTQLSMHAIPALAQSARVMEAIPNETASLLEEIRELRAELKDEQEGGPS